MTERIFWAPASFSEAELDAYHKFSAVAGAVEVLNEDKQAAFGMFMHTTTYKPVPVQRDPEGGYGNWGITLREKIQSPAHSAFMVFKIPSLVKTSLMVEDLRDPDFSEHERPALHIYQEDGLPRTELANPTRLLDSDFGELQEEQDKYMGWLGVAYNALERRGHDML